MKLTTLQQALIPTTSQALIESFIKPEGKIFLLYGERMIFKLSMLMISHMLSRGTSLALIDGCNGFNIHAITTFAREKRLDPDLLLKHIFISRGFTCYLMEAAITNRFPILLRMINSSTGVVFGLLDTFYDEQVPPRKAEELLTRVILTLQEAKNNGISLLLACREWNVLPAERNNLFEQLKETMDGVYRVTLDEAQTPHLSFEQQARKKGTHPYGTNSTHLHQ